MSYYLIYRIDKLSLETPYLFGWTCNKDILKSFLSQRSKKKYNYLKYDEDQLVNEFSESMPDDNIKIDYIKLKSITGRNIIFFTTINELYEVEKRIQAIFKDTSSLDRIKDSSHDNVYYFNLFINIKQCYADALFDIGFRPKEIDALYESTINDSDDYELMENYRESLLNKWKIKQTKSLPSIPYKDDYSDKIIYSLESFIKVLKDDL